MVNGSAVELDSYMPLANDMRGMGDAIAVPTTEQIQLFQDLLRGSQSASNRTEAVGDAGASPAVQSNAFDVAKAGLRDASDMYALRMDRLQQIAKAASRTNSVSEMFSFQLESIKMGVELDFTSKVVAKSSQDIEQLTRQQ